MVMDVERVAETVVLTTRPSYRQTSVYSLVEVDGRRRHKQEIKLEPALKPVKYSDTAFLLLNNTRKRFRSRTYYQPRMNQKSFADTTYTTPKVLQERFVSSMDLHSDEIKKQFKTSIEIKPRNLTFKSSVSYPNIESLSSASDRLANGFSHSNGDSMQEDDVDENMNRRIPDFQEKYDPGASQVFIPKRKDYNFSSQSESSMDRMLNDISNQILVDYSVAGSDNGGSGRNGRNGGGGGDGLYNGYTNMNGHNIMTDFSDF